MWNGIFPLAILPGKHPPVKAAGGCRMRRPPVYIEMCRNSLCASISDVPGTWYVLIGTYQVRPSREMKGTFV